MTATTASTDVSTHVNAPTVFKDADLASITDFNSVLALFEREGIQPESMSDYGTGFEILKDKATIVGVPFLIVEWRFNKSSVSEGESFVSAAIVTKDGRKLIVNDGSTGIREQLENVTAQRIDAGHPKPQAALMVKDGLTRSDYTYTNAEGKSSKATTFYLSE